MNSVKAYKQWLMRQLRYTNEESRRFEQRGQERMAAIFYGRWEAYQDALNQAGTLVEDGT